MIDTALEILVIAASRRCLTDCILEETAKPAASSAGLTILLPELNRDKDLDVNICKEKKQTNMRAAAADIFERLEPAIKFSLDESLDFIADDEIAEITPSFIRLRKRILNTSERHRGGRTRIRR